MQANVSELMRGLERHSFLNWAGETSRPSVPGEHMCKTNRIHKQILCHVEWGGVHLLQSNKQRRRFNGKICSIKGTIFAKTKKKTLSGFLFNFEALLWSRLRKKTVLWPCL